MTTPQKLFTPRALRTLLTTALLGLAALLTMATSVEEPARISEVSPASDAANVPLDAEVVIRFNAAVDELTVTPESVLLLDEDSGAVGATRSVGDSWEIVITPTEELAPETTYRVVLNLDLLRTNDDEPFSGSADALDLDYDPDSNTVSFTFTTALTPRLALQ